MIRAEFAFCLGFFVLCLVANFYFWHLYFYIFHFISIFAQRLVESRRCSHQQFSAFVSSLVICVWSEVRPPPRHSSISWKHTQYLVLFQISRIILPNKNRPIIKIVRIHVMTAGAGQTCQRCLTMFEMESKILEEDAHSRFKECLVALSHFKNPL